MVTVGVLKENAVHERRVALVPASVSHLTKKGLQVVVETGAGEAAYFKDRLYEEAGATVASVTSVYRDSDLLVKIEPPTCEEIDTMRSGSVLICLLFPKAHAALVASLEKHNITSIALDLMPRSTLAQTMDVLSSQSTAAGYRAVILAAQALPKFFPMLMTAAGTIPPARVLILGAGVAGLQAVATARRLGAVVEAFDVRQTAREEVLSLGAKFLDVGFALNAEGAGGYAREIAKDMQDRINAVIAERLTRTDVCITTALVPGQRAPILLTKEMVLRMSPGSVVVDVAAPQGGNCELTQPGKDVVIEGITIIGRTSLPSELAIHASAMYSHNMEKLILYVVRDGSLYLDGTDEITKACVVTRATTPPSQKHLDPNIREAV
jgi:NAD(P) transhydrogenase subunit alpha